ncbi:MAG: (2Fe-2S)-binding protein [Candidatus Binatia bacterium]|nr:(2Fe-2S)-binding protein [Candidatus Binatia bacterium]
MTERHEIAIRINGSIYRREVEPRLLLVHFIRDVIGLTGTHVGCETSVCGACTIMLNGVAVKSCTVLAVQADGGKILTIEGLAREDELHPIQQAFWECHGLQCGFCTPGMILSVYQLLQRNPEPTEPEIRRGLEGNLCRCTGYQHIVDSVQYAAKEMRGKR